MLTAVIGGRNAGRGVMGGRLLLVLALCRSLMTNQCARLDAQSPPPASLSLFLPFSSANLPIYSRVPSLSTPKTRPLCPHRCCYF
ncbi:hypothetical protein F4823DRAFT_504049 [Ustulina deusta]|nr:hypothetical protein F4823DRAFT_504049 [Ustulina deusta]